MTAHKTIIYTKKKSKPMTFWNLCSLSKGRQFSGKKPVWKCCLPGDSLQVRQTTWLKIWQGGKTRCQRPCRKGGRLSLHISSLDCRRCWAPVTWIHLPLKSTHCLRYASSRCAAVVFLNHTSEQHAFERTVAVVSFQLPRKTFGCTQGFPESKSAHDLNLFWAYHNVVRCCWLSKATPNHLQNTPASQGRC